MTQVTVKDLATTVDTPVESLLQQMREAGLPHTDKDQPVSDAEKQKLLAFLSDGGSKQGKEKKITLQRKKTTTLRAPGSKTISVEVRKKRTYVKSNPEELEAEKQKELERQRAAEEAARLQAEQQAKEQEEQRKREEQAK